eukprot:908761-Amphidinium_carterae.3
MVLRTRDTCAFTLVGRTHLRAFDSVLLRECAAAWRSPQWSCASRRLFDAGLRAAAVTFSDQLCGIDVKSLNFWRRHDQERSNRAVVTWSDRRMSPKNGASSRAARSFSMLLKMMIDFCEESWTLSQHSVD